MAREEGFESPSEAFIAFHPGSQPYTSQQLDSLVAKDAICMNRNQNEQQ